MSPRARCVAHPLSGNGRSASCIPKNFAKHRSASLPAWSKLDEYDLYYYLTVDCYIPASEVGKWIYVGDEVRIIDEGRLIKNYSAVLNCFKNMWPVYFSKLSFGVFFPFIFSCSHNMCIWLGIITYKHKPVYVVQAIVNFVL